MRISWVAYATDDIASLAKTGSAMRLGRRVSPSRSERMARPSTTRLPSSAKPVTVHDGRGTPHLRCPPDVTGFASGAPARVGGYWPCTS